MSKAGGMAPIWGYGLLWALLLLAFTIGGQRLSQQLARLQQDREHLAVLQTLHMEKRALLHSLSERQESGTEQVVPLAERLAGRNLSCSHEEVSPLPGGWQTSRARVSFEEVPWADVRDLFTMTATSCPPWKLESVELSALANGLSGEISLSVTEKPGGDSPRF